MVLCNFHLHTNLWLWSVTLKPNDAPLFRVLLTLLLNWILVQCCVLCSEIISYLVSTALFFSSFAKNVLFFCTLIAIFKCCSLFGPIDALILYAFLIFLFFLERTWSLLFSIHFNSLFVAVFGLQLHFQLAYFVWTALFSFQSFHCTLKTF